jgi:7,8-dihydropterin-6-yl-methyl-4-(beta-D-ribofuranosyl)aminobenzene 5'-phosphate synthase
MTELNLREVEQVSVTVLVDNYTDLFQLESRGPMRRPPMPSGMTPVAEHGLSVLIEVRAGTEEHTIMMDASLSSMALLHNMDVYGVKAESVEGVILSHGHMDHYGGLLGFFKKAPRELELILHPDAFYPRCFNIPGLGRKEMPSLSESALRDAGAQIRKMRTASTWYSNLVLSLGEIERVTDFERGFPWCEIKKDSTWSVDPFYDDQAVVLNVKGKGLVVISGCAHAGIINTVRHARKITGIGKVHAVMGGFHLTGPIFEPIIEATVREMKRLEPDCIIPMHCTGWKAINSFAREMPDQFFLNTVGTTYIF